MWIFRDGKKTVPTRGVIDELEVSLSSARAGNSEALLDSLIQAGELEAALADRGAPAALPVSQVTDELARGFLGKPELALNVAALISILPSDSLPSEITISPPEGFAFYALSPLDFAFSIQLPLSPGSCWGIIGIRSIGTTLSALAKASLERAGCQAERVTVRPTGHPFDRVTHMDPDERLWLFGMMQRAARFLVVDEGPGMSGSSFLSVAEALERDGVRAQDIFLAGSRDPDLDSLRATDAPRRWQRYHWQCVTSQVHQKYREHKFFGADAWRSRYFGEEDWPACWTQMERLKFLSPSEETLFKFEGLGRFGREVRERSERLEEGGFASSVDNAGDGMSAYRFVDGLALRATDLTPEVVDRIAEYCAYRRDFLVSGAVLQQLPEMLTFNLEQEFGASAPFDLDLLISERPIIADARMQPHEWIRAADGRVLKFDGSTHGDDHFFPGPTDIAWDLAGAIIEWQMDAAAAGHFISAYRALAGEDPSLRLPAYLLAYSMFRMSYCKMAADAERGSAEAARLERGYRTYRALAENQLARWTTHVHAA